MSFSDLLKLFLLNSAALPRVTSNLAPIKVFVTIISLVNIHPSEVGLQAQGITYF
jgi:hypothetical protein